MLESILVYITQGKLDGREDIAVVRDGLKMTLEVVEKLLAHPTGERREVLEAYHQKLTEALRATES
jgi:hypothetical protein